jgi:hypothetical protein
MDYAATVWHGTGAELTKIEQVQTRVLRRQAAMRENLADDFLQVRDGVQAHRLCGPAA